jgi:hypothetical protein
LRDRPPMLGTERESSQDEKVECPDTQTAP